AWEAERSVLNQATTKRLSRPTVEAGSWAAAKKLLASGKELAKIMGGSLSMVGVLATGDISTRPGHRKATPFAASLSIDDCSAQLHSAPAREGKPSLARRAHHGARHQGF